MRLSSECANLELDSGYVNVPASTTQTVEVAADVNLRVLLADMYNKYDYFLMVFNSFGGFSNVPTGYNGGVYTAVAPFSCVVSGLNFTKNSYNGGLEPSAIFPTKLVLPVNGWSYTNSPNNSSCVVFTKPKNELTRISCTFVSTRQRVTANIQTPAATVYSYDMNLNFSIYGLIDEQ